MVTVGSYMYVYDIPLGDFIGGHISMAFQCILSKEEDYSGTGDENGPYVQPRGFAT